MYSGILKHRDRICTFPVLGSTRRPSGLSPTIVNNLPSGLKDVCCPYRKKPFVKWIVGTTTFTISKCKWRYPITKRKCNWNYCHKLYRSTYTKPKPKIKKQVGTYIHRPWKAKMVNKLVSLHIKISDSTIIIRGSKMKCPTADRQTSKDRLEAGSCTSWHKQPQAEDMQNTWVCYKSQ